MQQWWFVDGFGLKLVYLWCFYDFPLFLRFSLIFMNMQIISNLHFCHGMKSICLTFNLVPGLEVHDKEQLRYD